MASGRTPLLRVAPDAVLLADEPLFRGDVRDLLDEVDRRRGTGRTLVTTPNVDQVLVLRNDEAARRAHARADLRTVDGLPIVALARLLGDHTVCRVTGADLLVACSAASAERGWRIVVTGGAPGTAVRAAERLRTQHPGADVQDVPFPDLAGGEDGGTVVERLRAIRPDVVFLCLGSPKQEAWFLRWEDALPDAVYVGAGAAVDFAAGARRRAPLLVQRLGLEWSWRLLQEPRRLAHRYLVRGPAFLLVVARSLLAARGRRPDRA
ncbi:glycosyltransferase [Curtobacterium sp. MCBD17_034]|uniref:WecB/TagA/CpsF family glycosyltransferase n=1 Tax=unclassified Curtobacterium TaxID=257496 RepID=UPI000DA6F0B8|nr:MULTISPECIES: WecB/TagA/CpsF family glycosyltransferase [unclassified Curtobacterium]PZF60233.1 glycosyltransferase [Curtobacterium sp. MCBD17_034]PZM34918.1 glycosyltransferase [Curtobacterium sp. MCBD17_031]